MASSDKSDEPVSKRRKIEATVFDIFFNEFKDYDVFMQTFISVLKELSNALVPAVIVSSDATCPCQQRSGYGKNLRSCECIADRNWDTPFPFGAFFANAIDIYNCLQAREMPREYPLKLAASKLLNYVLLDAEWHEELVKIQEKTHVKEETQVMVTLSEHFFGRLSVSDGYVLDRFDVQSDICKCGRCCRESLVFDDTSIGNCKVWHGFLDILFDSGDVAVRVPCDEHDEVEENISKIQPRSQILAQTIVFSLVHKIRHPDAEHFIIPSMISNNKVVKIVFYDAENDILMESKEYPFIWKGSVNWETAIAAWLALNHKILCTGPFGDFLERAPKSNFKNISTEALSIYETDLKLRNVIDKETFQDTETEWDRLETLHRQFVWPETVTKPGRKSKNHRKFQSNCFV